MAFQAVPDTASFTANFTGPDGTRMSFAVYSRDVTQAWGGTQLEDIAGALNDAIIADYLPALSSDFTFVNVTSRNLAIPFGQVIEHASANDAGTLVSPSLPAAAAVKATFIGAPGLAPARGGIFLLPPAESQVVANLVQAGPLALLQTAAESIHNAMSGLTQAHVIVSRYSGTTSGVVAGRTFRVPNKRAEATTNTVPTVIVHNRVDSQRKRRPSE